MAVRKVRKAPESPQQLDLLGGLLDKARGIRQVIDHSDERYDAAFYGWIERLPRGTRYVSEDVTGDVGMPPPGNHSSLVGALMNQAVNLGLCEATGDHTRSRRRRSHGALLCIWRRL